MQVILRVCRLLAAALILVSLLLGSRVPTSQAQGTCDQPVIDGASVFGDQLAQVEAAAAELSQRDAQVRVRTVASYAPASSLDDYARQLEQSCATWRTADGKRQPNLVVLLLARTERRTGVYYGAQWKGALDSRWTGIQNEAINPRFKSGDFAGGFVAGLQALGEAQQATATRPAGSTSAVAPANAGPGLGYCLGSFGLVVGLIGGGFGLRRRRKAQQQLAAARQRAGEAKRAVVAPIVAMPQELADLKLRLELLGTQIAPEDAVPLTETLAMVQQVHEQALLSFDRIGEFDPEQTKARLSVAEYEALAQQYQQLQPLAEQMTSIANQLQEQIQRIERAIEQMPQMISQGHAALEHAGKEIAAIGATGFKVDAQQAQLEQGSTALAAAQQAVSNKRFIQASGQVAQAQTLITTAVEQSRALPTLSQQLSTDLERLEERSAQAARLIPAGHETFRTISASYHPASWDTIKQHGSTAERLYAASQQALATGRMAATMERQEWTLAREQVTQADAALQQVEDLIDAITARKTELAAAQADAPGLLVAVREERQTIEAELGQYRADAPEQVWDSLRAAASDLATAERMLSDQMPNYLEVVEYIRRARTTAQDALAAARTAYQVAEEQRQRVAAALESAAQAIASADSYIDSTKADVSSAAKGDLKDARKHLRNARRSDNLATQLENAAKAEAQARDAYARAQRDVADAEKDRQVAVGGVVVASSSTSWSSSWSGSWSSSSSSDSDSSSGGGSSSWNSSSGGSSSWDSSGGGSSSWDSGSSSGSSSSDGGGGSTSW